MITLATDRKGNHPITLAADRSRAIFVAGKRGSGKSYTLGRIIEEYHRLNSHLIVVVDPLAVFWTTAIPLDGQDPISVRVIVPGDPGEVLGPLAQAMADRGVEIKRLWLNPSDLTGDAWLALFGLSLSSPQGIALSRAIRQATAVSEGTSAEAAQSPYTISDLITALGDDEQIAEATRTAVINRLDAGRDWGLFADAYRPITEVLDFNAVNVVDVSAFDPGPQSIRNLVVKLLAERLFRARFTAHRAEALGLPTSGTEQMLQGIDWGALLTPNGISHGYTYAGTPIPASWDTFGGESWLVQLAYAATTGKVAPIKYCNPPTANGSGFIDELAWLFAPPPPIDCWGIDWELYRQQAADAQLSYYASTPTLCLTQLGLFGLSAAEVPAPSAVTASQIYQAFGVGGRFSPPNDGLSLLGAPVAVPHYSAMIASLRSTQAVSMWLWLINQGPLSPLNNVESLMFPAGSDCGLEEMQWNELKGSWNLVLQTLGWGRYLAQRQGQVPVLWQTITTNAFLRNGYNLVASVPVAAVDIYGPSEVFTSAAQFSADYEPNNAAAPVTLAWDNGTVGASATYTWDLAGVYTVAVTATNHCGNLVTDTHPVTVHQVAGVALSPDHDDEGKPGDVITYTHVLTNTGNYTDTFDLSTSSGWGTLLTTAPLTLGSHETATVQVRVTIPDGVVDGTMDFTVITATSRADSNFWAGATDVTTVRGGDPPPIYFPLISRKYQLPLP